jgi:hypothetical protein
MQRCSGLANWHAKQVDGGGLFYRFTCCLDQQQHREVHLAISANVATGGLAAFSLLLLLLLLLLLSVTHIAVVAVAAARHGFQPKPFRETCNAAEYGSSEPPIYDFSKVTAPVVIFAGGQLRLRWCTTRPIRTAHVHVCCLGYMSALV